MIWPLYYIPYFFQRLQYRVSFMVLDFLQSDYFWIFLGLVCLCWLFPALRKEVYRILRPLWKSLDRFLGQYPRSLSRKIERGLGVPSYRQYRAPVSGKKTKARRKN